MHERKRRKHPDNEVRIPRRGLWRRGERYSRWQPVYYRNLQTQTGVEYQSYIMATAHTGVNPAFDDYCRRKQAEHGDKFDASGLAAQFIPYYHTDTKLRILSRGGTERTGTIGATTGYRPCFLLMTAANKVSSPWTLGDSDVITAINGVPTPQARPALSDEQWAQHKRWEQGYAISRIPEEIAQRHLTGASMTARYVRAKYSAYGFRKRHDILFNPAWKPDDHPSQYRRDVRGYRWVEDVSKGLRVTGEAHKIIRLDHTGYFTDNYQEETVWGMVYQLPARHGKPRYVPGVNDPNNEDSACLDFSELYEDKEDAARDADRMAEVWAEDEREYKEDAETKREELTADIHQAYADMRATIRQLRNTVVQEPCDREMGDNWKEASKLPIVRELVKAEWRRFKAAVSKLRKQRAKIEREGVDYGE